MRSIMSGSELKPFIIIHNSVSALGVSVAFAVSLQREIDWAEIYNEVETDGS